jgi:hypothetical protein
MLGKCVIIVTLLLHTSLASVQLQGKASNPGLPRETQSTSRPVWRYSSIRSEEEFTMSYKLNLVATMVVAMSLTFNYGCTAEDAGPGTDTTNTVDTTGNFPDGKLVDCRDANTGCPMGTECRLTDGMCEAITDPIKKDPPVGSHDNICKPIMEMDGKWINDDLQTPASVSCKSVGNTCFVYFDAQDAFLSSDEEPLYEFKKGEDPVLCTDFMGERFCLTLEDGKLIQRATRLDTGKQSGETSFSRP